MHHDPRVGRVGVTAEIRRRPSVDNNYARSAHARIKRTHDMTRYYYCVTQLQLFLYAPKATHGGCLRGYHQQRGCGATVLGVIVGGLITHR